MSIKKLFGSVEDGRNYLSDTDQKDAFKDVESERNLEQLKDKQSTFVPQVDYTLPSRFAKFGSAYLYYKGAMNQITDYYPYDGSDAEINKFYNNLLDIEKYIFNNLYPRRNGYVKLAESTGTGHSVTGTTGAGVGPAGYAIPTTNEYITLKAGPHAVNATASLVQSSNDPYSQKFQYSNVYDTSIYTTEGLPSDYGQGTRQSNLQSNFDTGVSIEFWMKKPSFNSSEDGNRETIFDLWTSGSHTSSADYGRIILELTGGATATSPFLLTVHSGATSAFTRVEIGSASLTPSSLATWTHIGLVMYNTGSDFISKLYVNGALNNTQTAAGTTINQLKQKDTMARIGALLTAPNDADFRVDPGVLAGANKLSASLDEFRFWKVKRSAQDIGRYWFTQVRGGSNTDISNTTLGVYYKFNEGITGTSSIDSNVLDYSGRISNGTWTGYGTNSRTINSAIVEASASATEYKDPIIYSTHPRVAGLKEGLLESGSYHDDNNNSLFMNYSPNWVIEEHRDNENSNLAIISHIMGSYFDKIYLQSRQLSRLKGTNYTSASAQPVPFAQHLPQSLGLYTPQIFIDATVMERFLDRNNDSRFSGSLEETKNLIYLNLYNNLTNIFKSKGTEKALRNVLRCFNVDEKLIKINTYANNTTFPLSNNYEQVLETKNYVNFNKVSNRSAVIYQSVSGSGLQSVNTASVGGPGVARGFISASTNLYEYNYGTSIEAEVLFPYWDNRNYSDDPRDYTTVSLFGMVTPETGSTIGLSGSDTTTGDPNPANFRVYAIKESAQSKNVYFYLTSSIADTGEDGPMPVLSSSAFFNVYDNTIWNFSVRVEPQHDTPTIYVEGGAAKGGSATYNVVFEGRNIDSGFVRNKFSVSGTMTPTEGNNFLKSAKRLYAGAERTNLTGTLVNKSDVLIGSMKYWAKYLEDGTLVQHAHDVDNYGISGSYRNVSAIDTKNSTADVLNLNTLALNWTFGQVTGSNAGGNFTIGDLSSGSALLQDNYATMGRITGYRHLGWGYGFPANSSGSIKKKQINTFKFIEPERATSGDAIQILSEDDKVFGVVETVPNYVYTVEKSMYRAISEEMLDFFAGVVDFNNLIGAPVNRYRGRYKALEQLRAIFFERVTKTSQVEKFVEYYKWFDDAMSQIMGQLVPASSDFTSDVYNTIESHALERNKYMTQYPTLETKAGDPNANIFGVGEMGVDYSQQSTTLAASPRSTKKHIPFWKKRAKRSSPEITSGDATIDTQRETYRLVINSSPRLSTKPVVVAEAGGSTYEPSVYANRNYQKLYDMKHGKINESLIHGGVNFERGKNIHYVYNSLYPFGPIDTTGGRFVPLNVLLGLTKDMTPIQNFLDNRELRKRVKRAVLVYSGRDFQKGVGYENMKSTLAFPFNIMSSSVTTGFNQEVVNNVGAGLEITNLHNDVYGPDMEVPMQGPFTEKYVGGHQSRHVALNTGSVPDTYKTRPEAWKLLVGECPDQGTGSVGMASPTYPYPDIGAPPSSSVGTIKITNTLGIGDYVTIGDGGSSVKFKIPFENDKAMLFQDRAGSLVALSGDASASYGLPSDHPLDYYLIEKGTISAWLRADRTTGTGWIFAAGLSQGIMAFGYRSDNKLQLYQQWYNADGGGNVNVDFRTDAAAITDGVWHHVAVTYDATLTGAMDPKFFVDGVLQASSVSTAVPTAAGSQLRLRQKVEGTLSGCGACRVITAIGGSGNATVAVSGALDEVNIWQLSMSVDQITELYATGSVLNLKNHSVYVDDSTNLYSWYRMGDDANDAIDGTGNYDLGTNSIVDQTGRANGSPRDVSSPAMSFTTNVITASADPDTFTTWTNGATVSITAQNLTDAVNASSLNINASKGAGSWLTLANTKYGVAGSSKRSARGSLGNVTIVASASSDQIWPFGMSGGVDPVILNFNAPRATYYRDFIAKSPVNIRNIQMKTGSTIIGNYQHNYEVVNSVGAFGNPRSFIENQPTLPSVITSNTNLNKGGSASFEGTQTGQAVLNYLTLNRESASHFDFGLDYGVTDNSGAYANKSIIVSRFGAPGGRETMARGYQDFRSSEYSVYNAVPYRNLTVLDAGGAGTYVLSNMDPTALIVTSSGYQITGSGYRVNDIHNRPFGLRQHLARHSGRFGRDSYAITGATFALNGPGASYNQLPAYNKTNRNPQKKLIIAYDGNYLTSSQRDNYFVSHQIPRSDRQYLWITSSLVSENDNFRYLPADYMLSTSAGYVEPYSFVTGSDNAVVGQRQLFYYSPLDFAGLNTIISEPYSASSNVLGYPALVFKALEGFPTLGSLNIINNTYVSGGAGALNYDLTTDNFDGSSYASSANLQGWWRLNTDLSSSGNAPDSSGNGRDGTFDQPEHRPAFVTTPAPGTAGDGAGPSKYIQTASCRFSGSYDGSSTPVNAVNIKSAATWDALIGRAGSGGTEEMTIAFWVRYADPLYGTSYTFSFGSGSLYFYTDDDGAQKFATKWDGVAKSWLTPSTTIFLERTTGSGGENNFIPGIETNDYGNWHHIALTYDAGAPANLPIFYIDGQAQVWGTVPAIDPGATWDGIQGADATIGRIYTNYRSMCGNLADFAVWNSILTANEVKALYLSAGKGTYRNWLYAYTGNYSGSIAPGVNLTASQVSQTPNSTAHASGLNSLLLHRNGPWGWPTWKQIDYNNPLTRYEHRNNTLSVYAPEHKPDSDFKYFDLSPVSMRGRPAKINFDTSDTEDVTLVASHNNMEIFFKSNELNDMVGVDYDEVSTPLEQVMEITRVNPSYSPNWIMYSENIFPSVRNEFESYATQRTGYNNKYWAKAQDERAWGDEPVVTDRVKLSLEQELSNSFGITLNNAPLPDPNYLRSVDTPGLRGPFFLQLTQSAWPLDPPQDFMTRTLYGKIDNKSTAAASNEWYYPILSGSIGGAPGIGNYYNIFRGTTGYGGSTWGAPGELQNYYVLPAQYPAYYYYAFAQTQMSPGALYARKQTLGSPRSVVSPTGIAIPATGSLTGAFDLYEQLLIMSGADTGLPQGNGIWAGEAAWDAPINASIIVQSGSIERSISRPSEPWFTTYDDFKQDLKLKAKDFSIVPEFRISNHVTDFKRYGISNQDKSNIFEIPGTGINSETTSSFYLDYSNSEFLKDFLKIKEDSLLDATEIKLECEAAIRFNPYKGFYPVQRSMDLVSQWSSSYFNGVLARIRGVTGADTTGAFGRELLRVNGGAVRPLIAPLFAPGILYNSIKSGMAVDYPVITDGKKILKWPFLSSSVKTRGGDPKTWSAVTGTNYFNFAITPNVNGLKLSDSDPSGYTGTGSFWDQRIPFEAIIKPELYMAKEGFIDMESHPSSSLKNVTTSMGNSPNDDLYSLMASNYFAEIGNFFLNKSQYTKLESDVVADKLLFESGSTYAARIKLRRSTTGPRIYTYEPDANGNTFAAMSASGHEASFYRPLGGTSTFGVGGSIKFFPTGAYFPLPQDPQFAAGALTGLGAGSGSAFRESFTLYSRPTAFGPPVSAGRISGTLGAKGYLGQGHSATPTQMSAAYLQDHMHHPMDSYNGYNWAFTPPYYNGESWADIIFRPTAGKEYSVEDILSEVNVKYWRYDGGGRGRAGDLAAERRSADRTALPQSDAIGTCKLGFTGSGNSAEIDGHTTGRGAISGAFVGSVPGIYDADSINRNAMQMSASINLFGIEKAQFTERDGFGNIISTRDTSTGTKWVIQPKFETPHVNFNKVYSQAKMPLYGSASVPIGVWHQFGEIPTDPSVGVFLEIDDIPKQWQRYHYEMYKFDSIYNDNNAAGYGNQQPFRSLSKVFGFKDETRSKRLGELKNSQTLREAIVAIPYITDISPPVNPAVSVSSNLIQANKKFISIPPERFEAAQKAIQGSLEGDSLLTAGESIRKLIQKMNRYILPPQFDFMNNRAVDPMVMYIFEFEYKLDRDDLSYIWQNLAPRDYQKLTFQKSSIAHELMDTELLSQANIMDNPNLRWMIFKVKQRSQATYDQITVAQAGGAPRTPFIQGATDPETGYKIAYNWPYDYISFVEMVKIDAQVLYGGRGTGGNRLAPNGISPSPLLESPSDLQAGLTPTPTPTATPTQQQAPQFSAFGGPLLGGSGGPGGNY